jgi:hypothetical protein
MTYDETRDLEQIDQTNHAISDFITRYNSSSVPPAQRQTLFLLPGGLASKLRRANTAFQDGAAGPQSFQYETVWFTESSLLGEALNLQLEKRQNDEYRDKADRIIVADGPIELLGCTPYDGFSRWCEKKDIDWFIFGYDWRRRLDHVVRFFVDKWLPHFQQRVKNECNNADPLKNFSLVGHSQGGMVVNWILRDNAPIMANMSKAITAGTPFYGYASQVHRWFEGEPLLNGPFNTFRDDIIKVISSLPALYALQFLDQDTFNANQAALSQDPDFPLSSYPSTDQTTGNPADPYNPQESPNLERYPSKAATGFDRDELANGATVVKFLASDLDPALAQKFFNIRGVQTTNDTAGSTTWRQLPPMDPSPIKDGPHVPGDGVQPAWTTRLATLDKGNCKIVKGATVDHQFLMNHRKTLKALAEVLGV